MPRRTFIAAAIVALAALLTLGPATTAAAQTGAGAQRVVVVLTPYLTWDDVLSGAMPSTRALAEKGVVGNVNVRSGTPGAGPPTLTRGALMLSAGASALSDTKALEGYGTTETVGTARASDLYRAWFARSPGQARVLFLGSARQATANAKTLSNTRVGALGQAMHDAGILTAAVGNSDPGLDLVDTDHARPAAVAAADEAGLVDLGDVSTALLAPDAAAPYGVRTDRTRLERAYAAALDGGARLVVIDPGDLARAYAMSSATTSEAAAVAWRDAIRSADAVVGMAAGSLDPGDTLIVLAPAVPAVEDEPQGFAPMIMSGPSRTGTLDTGLVSAASTRRVGICTVWDVTATITEAAGAERLPEMVGSTISGTEPGSLEERVAYLIGQDATARSVEGIRTSTINTYITLTIIALLVAAALVGDRGRLVPVKVGEWVRAALLLSLAFAPAGLLMFVVWRWLPATPTVAGVMLVATAILIWAVTLVVGRRRVDGTAVVALSAFTTFVLAADQWFGAPLSFAGVFGYSPLFGARYYGIGNEMAGALLGSAMVAGALALDLYRDRPWAAAARRFGWPILGVVVIVTTAAPFLGANIGAIAWMTVGFVVAWMVLTGRRVLTWKNVAIVVVLVLLLLAAASAADLLGSGSETHLGRAIADTEQSGVTAFLTLVARKAETNMRVLGRTNWTWLLVAVLVVLGYMRWRPKGEFAATLARYPALAAATSGSLAAGLVGYFTEDSGIIIPALALLPVGAALLYLMLSRAGTGEGGEA